MEKLVIEIETGNDAVQTRYAVSKLLEYYANDSVFAQDKNSGVIRDFNGNKVGEWKWVTVATPEEVGRYTEENIKSVSKQDTAYENYLSNETFDRT